MDTIHSKPSPAGEGGIRVFASMTDEVFAFSSSNFPSGIPCLNTSSTASGPPSPTGEGFLKSMRKHCISSVLTKRHILLILRNHSIAMYGFLYSKPSPVGEGGIRAFASMTDEVFAFSSSNFPCGILCPDTSSTASGPPSPTGEGFLSSTEGGIYSFRCKALLCFALRALLGFSERTEEQSALARLCKHRLSSLDYHPFQRNGI